MRSSFPWVLQNWFNGNDAHVRVRFITFFLSYWISRRLNWIGICPIQHRKHNNDIRRHFDVFFWQTKMVQKWFSAQEAKRRGGNWKRNSTKIGVRLDWIASTQHNCDTASDNLFDSIRSSRCHNYAELCLRAIWRVKITRTRTAGWYSCRTKQMMSENNTHPFLSCDNFLKMFPHGDLYSVILYYTPSTFQWISKISVGNFIFYWTLKFLGNFHELWKKKRFRVVIFAELSFFSEKG